MAIEEATSGVTMLSHNHPLYLRPLDSPAKGQIMLMIPTLTISEAYGIVVQDESQQAKTMTISGLEIGATAMAYNSGQGHTKDVCYKLVGYPPDYKPKKKTFGRNTAATHNAQVDYSKGPTNQGSFGIAFTWNFFTEEQYKQLLQLLNQNTTPIEIAAHAKVTSIPLSLISKVKQDRWIIDSGATNHMVFNLDFFTDFMEIPKGEGRKVQLSTGETSRITHLGSSSILNGLPIKNVLYVPQFRYNLLSVSQHTRDIGCFIVFFPAWCLFHDIYNGKVKGIGKLEEGLYVLDLKHKSNLKLPIGVITSALVINRISGSLWHKRLGHIPLDALKRLPAFHNKAFVDYVWGPFKVPTFDDKRYFLTLVDDFSRVPSRILSGKSPFEMVHKNVTLDHLKGYKLYDLHNNYPFVRRDVIFKEDVFPFLQHMNSPMKDQQVHIITPSYDSDSDDLVLTLPHHSTTSQDTSSSDLAYLDDSIAVTPPHIPHTEDLQGSSTSPDDLSFPDDFSSCPAYHTTIVPFPKVLPSSVADDLTATGIRKSTRPSRPPIWMNDYVVGQNARKTYSAEIELSSFSEAAKDPKWVSAMHQELQALKDNDTWSIVPLPPKKNCIGSKMVIVRTIIALAAHHGWLIYQMDVHNAFLQGALGGSASRQWNLKLTDALHKMGFTQSHYDHSLFSKRESCSQVLVLIYVDDLLVTGSDVHLIDKTGANL
uniref:Reverse transcriptase Ty1/copia-type domain-containing protein n=2 Tax=Nicotiana TaxID=4085 RepID=A0A1S3Y1Z5_TOBAC|nr:PREDICTED: uncharacterized protein LOC104227031 [Nicotiana sylvestris]XP_016446154.1 PREDICTED: uncharacterized protein LOC107771318 [Nicotiana tabacum]